MESTKMEMASTDILNSLTFCLYINKEKIFQKFLKEQKNKIK